MCGVENRGIWRHGIAIVVLLIAVTLRNPVEGWAVLMETNDYPEGYDDLPVDFVDIERMQTMLQSHGWSLNHILVKKDGITSETIKEGVAFLKSNADHNDIVVFYIASHGGYLRHDLKWNTTFPPLWEEIKTPKRLLIVDSCFAASFLPESDRSLISIASVSEKESGWAGVPEEGLPIEGFVFTYYFCESMSGQVSVEEGFSTCVPQVQKYMKEVVYPEFKDVYPAEHYYNMYDPHPVMVDQYPGSFFLEVKQNAPLSVFCVFMGMLLALRRKR